MSKDIRDELRETHTLLKAGKSLPYDVYVVNDILKFYEWLERERVGAKVDELEVFFDSFENKRLADVNKFEIVDKLSDRLDQLKGE